MMFAITMTIIEAKHATSFQMCTVSALCELIGKTFKYDMKNYQLYHLGKAVDEVRQGSENRIGDYSIKPGSTVVVMKKGLVLEVTNAKVSQQTPDHITPCCWLMRGGPREIAK